MLRATVSSITPSIDGVAGLVGTQEIFPFVLTIHLHIWTIGVYGIQKDGLRPLPLAEYMNLFVLVVQKCSFLGK